MVVAMSSTDRNEVRRQTRGLQRIESILDAAATVFAELGYDQATTNKIAARAGISPGSLYQFFANKPDIARALAERLTAQILHSQSGLEEVGDLDLAALVDRIVDPLIAFNVANPAFLKLFGRLDLPDILAHPIEPIEKAFHERLAATLADRNPGHEQARIDTITTTSIDIFRGLAAGIAHRQPDERTQRINEIKRALIGYLNESDVN